MLERRTPSKDVVSEEGAALAVVVVRVRGVRDDDVQVEGLVHQPREVGQEEVVEQHRENLTHSLYTRQHDGRF